MINYVLKVFAIQFANQIQIVLHSKFARMACVFKKLNVIPIRTVDRLSIAEKIQLVKLNAFLSVMDLYFVDEMLNAALLSIKLYVVAKMAFTEMQVMKELVVGQLNVIKIQNVHLINVVINLYVKFLVFLTIHAGIIHYALQKIMAQFAIVSLDSPVIHLKIALC